MAWQTWELINQGDIIKASHLEQIKNNLNYLSDEKITDRCIGYYTAICSTDNTAWRASNNTSVGNSSCGDNNSTWCSLFNNLMGHRSGRGSSSIKAPYGS